MWDPRVSILGEHDQPSIIKTLTNMLIIKIIVYVKCKNF